MPFIVIDPTRVDAKSPVDDNLMGDIKTDLDYLVSLLAAGNTIFTFNVNGSLPAALGYKKPMDTGAVYGAFTPGFARAALKKSGTSGTLQYDIRKHSSPKTPIIGIENQYLANTQSIGQTGSAINTQSIARAANQIATQSITHAKAAANVQSIIQVPGTNMWRYNLDVAPDSDCLVGDSFTFAGCSSGGNNGTFVAVELNQSGFPSVVVVNASGVAQSAAAGTSQAKIMSYNYANPVDSQYAAGDSALFATHTTGANNGTLAIFKTNQSGNNVWVKNATGVLQAGVAGTIDCLRWRYAASSSVSSTNYVVGEKAKMATHSTGANNGNFTITGVNVGGNGVTVYNTAGVAQAGVAGTINTNRWSYGLLATPAASVTVGDSMTLATHTTPANNGVFIVKEINNNAANNLVFYNESGVAQAGVAGTITSDLKLIKFAADQSATYTTASYIEMRGCADPTYNSNEYRSQFLVREVNRGGGSNYNVVIQAVGGAVQLSPAGYVQTEAKSIFNTPPSISVDVTSLEPNMNIVQTSTDIIAASVPAGTMLGLYILSIPSGDPTDFSLTLH